MTIAQQIEGSLVAPTMIVNSYLEDLSDEELLIRPIPGMNHINWQMGHVTESEHNMMETICPGSMPVLPDNFSEMYSRENADSDDPEKFLKKEQLLEIMNDQRKAAMVALDKMSDEDLMQPAPEKLQMLGPTVGSIVQMLGTHWVMHAGQWVAVRRQLGKPALF